MCGLLNTPSILCESPLIVTATELRVTLALLSSPHRTRAVAALCEELNQSATLFPGSKIRLRYAVREVS